MNDDEAHLETPCAALHPFSSHNPAFYGTDLRYALRIYASAVMPSVKVKIGCLVAPMRFYFVLTLHCIHHMFDNKSKHKWTCVFVHMHEAHLTHCSYITTMDSFVFEFRCFDKCGS